MGLDGGRGSCHIRVETGREDLERYAESGMQRDKVGIFLLIGWTRSRQRERGDSQPHWVRRTTVVTGSASCFAPNSRYCEEWDDRLDGCGIQGVQAHPSGGLAVKARLQRASPRLLTTGREIAA